MSYFSSFLNCLLHTLNRLHLTGHKRGSSHLHGIRPRPLDGHERDLEVFLLLEVVAAHLLLGELLPLALHHLGGLANAGETPENEKNDD